MTHRKPKPKKPKRYEGRDLRNAISQIVLKWYGQTIQAAIGELLALHEASPVIAPSADIGVMARNIIDVACLQLRNPDRDDGYGKLEKAITEHLQNALASQSEKLRVMRTSLVTLRSYCKEQMNEGWPCSPTLPSAIAQADAAIALADKE